MAVSMTGSRKTVKGMDVVCKLGQMAVSMTGSGKTITSMDEVC